MIAQVLHITGEDGVITTGRVARAKGKEALIAIDDPLGVIPDSVVSVLTLGKDAPTNAERERQEIILEVLQELVSLHKKKAFEAIWFPRYKPHREADVHAVQLPSDVTVTLNPSQELAVKAILYHPALHHNVVDTQLIIGPPGSGKTTVISAAVQGLRAAGRPVWLVAQSNVAVKNIAEKLVKIGFLDFRIVVSKEFHLQW